MRPPDGVEMTASGFELRLHQRVSTLPVTAGFIGVTSVLVGIIVSALLLDSGAAAACGVVAVGGAGFGGLAVMQSLTRPAVSVLTVAWPSVSVDGHRASLAELEGVWWEDDELVLSFASTTMTVGAPHLAPEERDWLRRKIEELWAKHAAATGEVPESLRKLRGPES